LIEHLNLTKDESLHCPETETIAVVVFLLRRFGTL